MTLDKIPTFQEVKDWANSNLISSVNSRTGTVTVPSSSTTERFTNSQEGSKTHTISGSPDFFIISMDSYRFEENGTSDTGDSYANVTNIDRTNDTFTTETGGGYKTDATATWSVTKFNW
jgi:hypothetical protein